MEANIIYEIIGYVASVLVAISLMMSKIVQLRIVNLVGAATFSLYGILISSIPVAAMNGFIVLINIYYLSKIFRGQEYFKILSVGTESEYLNEFLSFYKKEIKKFQPGFRGKQADWNFSFFVLRDMVPAGVLAGTLQNGTLKMDLDFVSPSYRDFKIAEYVYRDQLNYMREKGVKEIVTPPGSEKHNAYLEEAGFSKDERTGEYKQKV
ncbi:hypothetical protein DYD21_18530 [Rhodohalobacter sp. SW132]|uniref:hypothetical protein n=1 Tax=Rhodohalobacter sp. SW132 TaxID=2293433 RepID=UPI000E22E643|nr:hypothetical protein [Rhodohalobacter sp. SW132]REL24583.1 hypothetical protein DYD21_18530 [Rhodohalobacter sp. SW132]